MDSKKRIAMQRTPKCGECGGTLERKTITHIQPWGAELFRFEEVPASVCIQCGHVWLSAEISQLMDKIIQKHTKPKKYQKVPVFSLAELIEV